MSYRGWITGHPDDGEILRGMGVKLGALLDEVKESLGDACVTWGDCWMSDTTFAYLDEKWGQYIWGLVHWPDGEYVYDDEYNVDKIIAAHVQLGAQRERNRKKHTVFKTLIDDAAFRDAVRTALQATPASGALEQLQTEARLKDEVLTEQIKRLFDRVEHLRRKASSP